MAAPGTEAEAYLLFERLRWGGPPGTCPHCGAEGRSYYLRPASGTARRTRSGGRSERRVWKCGRCRRQFSVLTGTVFEGTRIPLRTWIGVVGDRYRSGPSTAAGVADRYGLSGEAAHQVLRRLESAVQYGPAVDPEGSGHELLAALLHIPAADAARIRAQTPGRLRPRRQNGPSADFGDEA